IGRAGSPLLAEAIGRLRRGEVIREAGYDGEYGVIRLFDPDELRRPAGVATLFEVEPPAAESPRQPRPTAQSQPASELEPRPESRPAPEPRPVPQPGPEPRLEPGWRPVPAPGVGDPVAGDPGAGDPAAGVPFPGEPVLSGLAPSGLLDRLD